MELESLLTGIKWKIIALLSTSERTTSELSDILQTSPANISQQIKQLQLVGLVNKIRKNNRVVHSLAKQINYNIQITFFGAEKKIITPQDQEYIFMLSTNKNIRLVLSALLKYDLLKLTQGLAILNRDNIQILLLSEELNYIREHYSSMVINDEVITVWSHNEYEIMQGLQKKEEYYLNLIRDLNILYDPKQILEKLT